jgi:hypothetical protein
MSDCIFLDEVGAFLHETHAILDLQALKFFFHVQTMGTSFRRNNNDIHNSLQKYLAGKNQALAGVKPGGFPAGFYTGLFLRGCGEHVLAHQIHLLAYLVHLLLGVGIHHSAPAYYA